MHVFRHSDGHLIFLKFIHTHLNTLHTTQRREISSEIELIRELTNLAVRLVYHIAIHLNTDSNLEKGVYSPAW